MVRSSFCLTAHSQSITQSYWCHLGNISQILSLLHIPTALTSASPHSLHWMIAMLTSLALIPVSVLPKWLPWVRNTQFQALISTFKVPMSRCPDHLPSLPFPKLPTGYPTRGRAYCSGPRRAECRPFRPVNFCTGHSLYGKYPSPHSALTIPPANSGLSWDSALESPPLRTQGYFLGSPTAETPHFLSPLGSSLRMPLQKEAWENDILRVICLCVSLSCPFTLESL